MIPYKRIRPLPCFNTVFARYIGIECNVVNVYIEKSCPEDYLPEQPFLFVDVCVENEFTDIYRIQQLNVRLNRHSIRIKSVASL